jgi:undecaprenyl-diphosphatase
MTVIEAIVLGLVQGLTEFLPISSTAHLRIAPELFGWADPGAAYSAIIQLGTTAAVLIYFAKDLGRLARAFFKGLADRDPFGTTDAKLAWFVLVGTLPIGIAGLALKDSIETSFRSLYVIASSLIALALVLWWVEKRASHHRTLDDMGWKDGILVGLWQALALIPGSSRSGTTITGGLSLGLRREDAARYSFLLSVPATLLAGIFELREVLQAPAGSRPSGLMMAIGTLVAFASGMAAIAWLLRFLRTRTMTVFIAYRIALGLLLFGLLASGRLSPHAGVENVDALDAPGELPVPERMTD